MVKTCNENLNKMFRFQRSHWFELWKIAVLEILQPFVTWKIAKKLGRIFKISYEKAHFYNIGKEPASLMIYEFL